MRRRRKPKNILTLFLALVAAIAGGTWTATHRTQTPTPVSQPAGQFHVTKVYDGDTIQVSSGERVRLIGIDTPESHDNVKLQRDVQKRGIGKKAQISMGQEASRFTKELVQGQAVRLEYDVEQRDRYGRLLAYVYLADGTFVNEQIIRQGYAYPLTIPPNVRHADDFKRWFDEAREAKRGLWK